jgi:undecaprenyl-diphosphatase
LAVFGAVLLLAAFYCDTFVQSWILELQSRTAKIFMRNVSRFGDWPAHVILGVIGMGVAYLRGSKHWVRIFTAMIVACALAGLVARAGKIVAGRARPSVATETAWAGPQLSSKFHAFPSGHTAASTAFFLTLFFAHRRVGSVLLAIPLLIGFSRMYVAAHYISDVVGGALLGIAAALVVWSWLARGEARTREIRM